MADPNGDATGILSASLTNQDNDDKSHDPPQKLKTIRTLDGWLSRNKQTDPDNVNASLNVSLEMEVGPKILETRDGQDASRGSKILNS